MIQNLLVLILSVNTTGIGDVEVLQLVGGCICCNDVKVITEVLLLEVLFGEVLEVALGERKLSSDRDEGRVLSGTCDSDTPLQVTSAAVDLDLVLQELLEGCWVEHLVVEGGAAVKSELLALRLLFLGLGHGDEKLRCSGRRPLFRLRVCREEKEKKWRGREARVWDVKWMARRER